MKDLNCLESEFAKKSFKDVFDGLLSNADSVEGLILSKDAKANPSADGYISELKRKVAEVFKDKTSGLDILDEKARDYINDFSSMKSKMAVYAEGFNPDVIGQWLAISDTSVAPNGFIMPVGFSIKDRMVKCIPGQYQRAETGWKFVPDTGTEQNDESNSTQSFKNQSEDGAEKQTKQEREYVEISLDDFNKNVIENPENKQKLKAIKYMNPEDAMDLAFRVNKKTDNALKNWVYENKDNLPFTEYVGAVLGLPVLDNSGKKIGQLVKSKDIFVAKDLNGKKFGISTGRPGSKVIHKDKEGDETEVGMVANYDVLTDHNFNSWYDSIINKDKLLKLYKFVREDHWSLPDIRDYMIKNIENGYFTSYDPSINVDKSGKTYEGLVAMPSDTAKVFSRDAGTVISSDDPKYDIETTYSVDGTGRNYVNEILTSCGIDSREMTKPILLKTKKVLGHKSGQDDYAVYKLDGVVTPHPIVWNAANGVIEYGLGYGNREPFNPDDVKFKLSQVNKNNGHRLELTIGQFRQLLGKQDDIDSKTVADYAFKYRDKLTKKNFSAWSTFRLTPDIIRQLLRAYMHHNDAGKNFPYLDKMESYDDIANGNNYRVRDKKTFDTAVKKAKNYFLTKGLSETEAERFAQGYVAAHDQINVIKIYEDSLAQKGYSPFVTRALNAICNVNPKEATYMVKPAVNGKGAGGGYGYSIVNLRSGFDPEDIGTEYPNMSYTDKLQRADKQM